MNNTYQKPGLYIHIPFCRTKCPYCGFYSIASTSLVHRWLNALNKEVRHYSRQFQCFDSLYLGGGTPTLLCVKDLEALMKGLFAHFDFAPDTEITIEANPGDLKEEKIDGLGTLGFNRINLGVQSFDDKALRILGRTHTGEQAEEALKRLRSSGYDNIGIDLIYGLAGQALEAWMETLKRALEFRPEHISCYQLSLEKGTPFWRMKEKGMISPIPEEAERAFFMATSRFLEDMGYIHYEVSNFARAAGYYARHNGKYWYHAPYLGLGPSAHSFQHSNRWWNVRSTRRYCEALESRKAPVEGFETLTADQIRLESIALSLRTRYGFDLEDACFDSQSRDMLFNLEKSGFLQIKKGRIVPTVKGFLVADFLPLCFNL